MIKAVIFDMDGVMIDSEPLWEKAERILLGKRGIDYTPDYRDKIVGLNQNDSGALLIETFNLDESVVDIINERVKILTGIYEKELKTVEGLLPLLDEIKEQGIPLAVASSSPMRLIKFVLNMFSLNDYFDVLVSGECIENGKPHPDIYLEAARQLGVEPSECLAIEDSINGVLSAKSAGMVCIAVPDKRLTPDKFANADKIVDRLENINLSLIQSCG